MENAWTSPLPAIIQGGMGVGISGPKLARAVSMRGQLGTVSGVALDRVVAIILQLGDPGGYIRTALSHFPYPDVAKKVLEAFSPKNDEAPKKIFRSTPIYTIKPSELLIALTICANFAFVWLAKEGHDNPVSINYLEKLSMPHVYAITGAMMAGVDYITMGAGIPMEIPQVIKNISQGQTAYYKVPVIGKNIHEHIMELNPEKFFSEKFPALKKPGFIPIIASNLLAYRLMTRLPAGSIQGFVVERPSAGGHNASPKKPLFDDNGEPIYGERDIVDYRQIAEFGLPFWIGGSCASPKKRQWAKSVGAIGIQVGSIFALCEESGMDINIKNRLKKSGYEGNLKIRTDSKVSPTGYPFKVACLDGTISKTAVYKARVRICDHKALAILYERADGSISCRCGAEPESDYIRKGGDINDTLDQGCLCSGLLATAGLQIKNTIEAPIVTLGEDLSFLRHVMTDVNSSYSAEDAINYLLSDA